MSGFIGFGGLFMLRSLCVVLLAALPIVSFAARPEKPALSADEVEKITAGKIVIRSDDSVEGLTGVEGFVEIKAPAAEIWKVLLDTDLIQEANGSVKSLVTYRDEPAPNGGRAIGLHYVLTVAWTDVSYHTLREYRPTEDYMSWTLDKSFENDIEDTQGAYVVWPSTTPDTVLLAYATRVDSGRKIPAWIQEWLTGRSLKGYLKFVKVYAEKANGTAQ